MTEAIKRGLQELIQDLQSKQESLQKASRDYRETEQYLTDRLNTIDANGANEVQALDILVFDPSVEKALQSPEMKHVDRVVMIARANGGMITAKLAVDVLMRLGVSKAKARNLNSTVHRILNDQESAHFEPHGPRGQYRLREVPEN